MTIRYKSDTFNLTNTDLTTVLTCPSTGTIIIKAVQAVHNTASNVDTDLYIRKNGAGSDVQISHEQINKETNNLISNSLNLEPGDILKLQASTGNEISGIISYALIDRSQENG
mgnify:FL=1|jgi:hypothetical protein